MMPVFSTLRLISGHAPQGMQPVNAYGCVFARNNGIIRSVPALMI